MADPVELLPLLVVVVLLMTVDGHDVDQMEVVFEGDREVTEMADALVVGGGTTTIPAGETVNGTVYLVGGDLDVRGRVHGDVDQLLGNVSVASGGTVTGELRTISGDASVAPGATVGSRSTIRVAPQEPSPAREYGFLALRTLVLALVAGALARRRPALLRNVGDSIVHHPGVSGVVGAFTSVTALALFVFMAFTLVLVPVSLFGVGVGLLSVAYAVVAFGYLVGERLPIGRPGLASAVGTALFALALDLLGSVPLVGATVQLLVLLTGLGAVLVTYYGLREFEPALTRLAE